MSPARPSKLFLLRKMFSGDPAYPSLLQAVRRRFQIWVDRRAGLDFLTVVQPEELGLDARLVHRGSPSGSRYLQRVLADLNIRPTDTVLDIGCAKGSAMRTMLWFPFRRIDGLEISEKLAGIATNNFKRLGTQQVQIFHADATDFTGYGLYNVFYLYNPFPEEVMRRVLGELMRQINLDREIVVIYNTPTCHELLAGHGFTAMRDYPGQWGNGIRVYSTAPASSRLLAD